MSVNIINGDFMRKYLVYIIIFLICTFSSLLITKSNKDIPVFNEDLDIYDLYTLDLSKEDINTNNIMNYFDNIKILEIYPYINPIYKKVINLNTYKFNTYLSNKKNISLFMTEYLNKLEDNNLKEEIVKYSINGVKINKIKVYSSNSQINNLIYNNDIKIIKK